MSSTFDTSQAARGWLNPAPDEVELPTLLRDVLTEMRVGAKFDKIFDETREKFNKEMISNTEILRDVLHSRFAESLKLPLGLMVAMIKRL